MSIDLDPASQLSFHRPFTQLVSEILTITNKNSDPVAFKVKTTAPKQYCVRPNSGRIEPNDRVEVKVILQPMKEDPPLDFKCKDKFLVQSVMITPDLESLSLTDLWTRTELQSKDNIKEHKIRCVYLPPVSQVGSVQPGYLPPVTQDTSTQLGFLPETPATQKQTQNFNHAVPDIRVPPADNASYSTFKADSEASTITEKPVSEQRPAPVSAPPQTPAMIGSFPKEFRDSDHKSVPSYSSSASYSDDGEVSRLQRQLYEANEEIKRLKNRVDSYKQELSTAQMRQRKNDEVSEKNGAGLVRVQERIPEGYYPFETLVAAVVAAFVLGVLFF